jgi:hypothetical protein
MLLGPVSRRAQPRFGASTDRLRLAIEKAPALWEGQRVPFTDELRRSAVLEGSIAAEMDAVRALEALVSRADEPPLSEAKASGRNPRLAGEVVSG